MKYYKCGKCGQQFTGWGVEEICGRCGGKLKEIPEEKFYKRSRDKKKRR